MIPAIAIRRGGQKLGGGIKNIFSPIQTSEWALDPFTSWRLPKRHRGVWGTRVEFLSTVRAIDRGLQPGAACRRVRGDLDAMPSGLNAIHSGITIICKASCVS